MRHFTTLLSLTLAVPVLLSCGHQDAAVNVDPQLGEDCFEMLRSTLPVGTQYEGIDGAKSEHIEIRIMDGTGVTTVECPLEADGTLSTGNPR